MSLMFRSISCCIFMLIIAVHFIVTGVNTLVYLTTWSLFVTVTTFMMLTLDTLWQLKAKESHYVLLEEIHHPYSKATVLLFQTALTINMTVTIVFWGLLFPTIKTEILATYPL